MGGFPSDCQVGETDLDLKPAAAKSSKLEDPSTDSPSACRSSSRRVVLVSVPPLAHPHPSARLSMSFWEQPPLLQPCSDQTLTVRALLSL